MKIIIKIHTLLLFLGSFVAFAHESRPVYIQIKQSTKNTLSIKYSVPSTVNFRNLPTLQLGSNFQKDSTKTRIKINTESFDFVETYQGNIQDLKQQSISLVFPYSNPTLSSVIQIYFEEKSAETYILSPTNNNLDLRKKTKTSAKSADFFSLGIEHIFKGIDHLLFVVCLLIITGWGKKLWLTITGFTIAHSITLFLSVLGWVNLPIPFVEVCIALSILFLCSEILRNYQGKTSLTYRYPLLISTVFGLLHGCGFAAVLLAIGLPQDAIVMSLLFFNIGVEIGQILFILGIFAGIWLLSKLFDFIKNKSVFYIKVATYGIGILAAFWFFERIAAW